MDKCHWIMVFISIKESLVLTIDPFTENIRLQDRVQTNASNYLKHFGIPAVNKWFVDEVSRQNDLTNCGVYCCFYASHLIDQFIKKSSIKSTSLKMEEDLNKYKEQIKKFVIH